MPGDEHNDSQIQGYQRELTVAYDRNKKLIDALDLAREGLTQIEASNDPIGIAHATIKALENILENK